ncbi:hypothetical protein [Priestia aryabhattai]|uniref:hypothetical protein n=1 Tax=Priestia aryabhattai TaxID=412384 RepID=UPI0023B113CD|nr:hypothetical protein [Priestia aryabhattai]MDE8676442.1 hypothetical protein [Priestia aryabhattai]
MEDNKQIVWVTCPRCESKKIVANNKLILFFLLVGGVGFLNLIGLFFWPLLIISIPMIFLTPLIFLVPKVNRCLDCLYVWKLKKNKRKQVDIAQ